MKSIYLAQVNSDSVEGRGYMETIAIFWGRPDAEKAVEGRGPMGMSNGDVVEAYVYDNIYEWKSHKRAQLRAEVLARLTPEEREALQ